MSAVWEPSVSLRRPLVSSAAVVAVVSCLVLGGCSSAKSAARAPKDRVTSSTAPTTVPPVIAPGTVLPVDPATSPTALTQNLAGGFAKAAASVPPDALAAVAVGPVAIDFLDLINKAKAASYEVGYASQGDAVAKLPSPPKITIAHTPSSVRNAVVTDPLAAVVIAADGGPTVSCARIGAWKCAKDASVQPFGADALLYSAALIAANPGAFDMTTSTSSIVGVPVRCIAATPVAGASVPSTIAGVAIGTIELCVTAQGVPLRVSLPQLRLEGVYYRPQVSPDAFVPPAPVA